MSELSLGRFHEISLSTRVLADSLDFYAALGFQQCAIESVWSHPYAVVRCGSLVLGLHEYRFPSPSVTYVREDFAAALEAFRASGAVIAFAQTGPDCFNEFGLRDPAGHMITFLERSTHQASRHDPTSETYSNGKPIAFSLPSAACEISSGFWQAIGAHALPESIGHFPALLHDAAGIPLAIHDESWFDKPALVFCRAGISERLVLESPEGTPLIMLPE
jgi:catechol 2,3-dioxygenase-like lactoylglutathione lyase family enzyme